MSLKERIDSWKKEREERIHGEAVLIQTRFVGNAARGCLKVGDIEGYEKHLKRWVDALSTRRKYTSRLILLCAEVSYHENRSLSESLKDKFYGTLDYCLR